MTIQDGEPALSRYHLKSLVRLRFGHSCRKARVTWYPAIRSGQLADCESIRIILYVPISSSIPSARAAIPKCRPICRAIIAVVSLTAYTAGISQLLPAGIGHVGGTATWPSPGMGMRRMRRLIPPHMSE